MCIQDRIKELLDQQPILTNTNRLYYIILSGLTIICSPFILVTALCLFVWFMHITLYALGALVTFILIKASLPEKVSKNFLFPSINELTNRVSEWAQHQDYEVQIQNEEGNNSEIRIILISKNKSASEIIIDYEINQFDECLIVEYQNYQYRESDHEKMLTTINILSRILDTLISGNYQIIFENYHNKLIDSELKVIVDNEEIVFSTLRSAIIARSLFRKLLPVTQHII